MLKCPTRQSHDTAENTPAASAGKAGDKCTKSHKDQGGGSHRDKLYKYKSKLKTNIDNILDLDTSENYLTLEEGSEAVLQENEIFMDKLKDVTEYLTISCTRVLDFVDRIKKHSEEVLI